MLQRRFRIKAIVPSITGWDTYAGAFVSLLVFGLVAVAGEWLVHQVEYSIEYGNRFNAVMASTPHRLYMALAGAMLAAVSLGLITLAFGLLYVYRTKRRELLLRLPPRLARHAPDVPLRIPLDQLALTALGLAVCQILLYLIQENVESAAVGRGWPGLWTLLAPQHATVIPLHLFAATCGALVLCLVTGLIRQSRRAAYTVEILVRMSEARKRPPLRLAPPRHHVPNLRLMAGVFCPRSPPLHA